MLGAFKVTNIQERQNTDTSPALDNKKDSSASGSLSTAEQQAKGKAAKKFSSSLEGGETLGNTIISFYKFCAIIILPTPSH